MENYQKQVHLGNVTKRQIRSRAHGRYISKIKSELLKIAGRRNGVLPAIYTARELLEHDVIVIEGEDCWSSEMDEVLTKNYREIDIHRTPNRVEIIVPVVLQSNLFIWRDFTTCLFIIAMCIYLLYYYKN